MKKFINDTVENQTTNASSTQSNTKVFNCLNDIQFLDLLKLGAKLDEMGNKVIQQNLPQSPSAMLSEQLDTDENKSPVNYLVKRNTLKTSPICEIECALKVKSMSTCSSSSESELNETEIKDKMTEDEIGRTSSTSSCFSNSSQNSNLNNDKQAMLTSVKRNSLIISTSSSSSSPSTSSSNLEKLAASRLYRFIETKIEPKENDKFKPDNGNTLETSISSTFNQNSFNNNNSKFLNSDCIIPSRVEYLLDMPPCSFSTQIQHSWNPDDRSLNIFVKEVDPLTLHRHPVAQSTDCIRTKLGYTKGIHLWELSWNSRQRGTHAIIGVASDKTALHCVGYQSLIGSNNESWGWDLGRNRACHNTKVSSQPPPVYPKMIKTDETFIVPDNFMMCLDMDEGTLSFLANGQYLGVAFRGLKGKKVFPIVSAVWGHCEITMKYINGLDPNPLPLTDLCRRTIRQKIGKNRLNEINKLELPNIIKNYLLFKQ